MILPASAHPPFCIFAPAAAGDIYAFGLILYQLLTGKAPFEGELSSLDAVKDAVRQGRRPSWEELDKRLQQQPHQLQVKDVAAVAEVMGDLRAVVEECWQGAPEKRPTASMVLSLLEGLQLKLPASV